MRAESGNSLEGIPILTTKLHIPLAAAKTVERRRLLDSINRGLRSKIIFLSAPAGFGKSTLLEQWARQAEDQPAWYSIDAGDNDPARFWQYIVAAIDMVVPGFGEKTDSVVKLIQPGQYEVAITMLLNELHQLERPLVLVLDDFHAISDESVLAAFTYFIEYLPEHVHLVAASRTEPAFPAARLMSRQWMDRLDIEDLRFTEQEGGEFYANCMELELPGEEVGEWVQRTEGWITAMKLAALSLRGAARPSMLLRKFSGSSRLLEQYLLEEVFLQQSETIRRFLTNCSVLKRMSAPLCRAVAGFEQSQEILEQLENSQLFIISLDEQHRWYRFHHLFAEFLYARLQQTESGLIPRLLEQAGLWCEQEGLHEEALEYYLTGRHYERGIRLLEAMTAKRMHVSPVWLGAQFSRIPEELLIKHPFLYFSYVHMFMVDTRYAKAEQMMSSAEQHYKDYEQDWTEEDRNDFWGSFYYLKMIYTSIELGDQEQALHYMRMSRQYRPTGTRLIFAKSGIAGQPSIAQKFIRSDKFIDKSANLALLENMVHTLGEVGASMMTCLAEAYYGYNELDKARATAGNALDMAAECDPNVIPEILLAARLVLFRTLQAGGRRAEAKALMRKTRQEVIELGMAGSLLYCDAELALMALQEGDTEPGAAWIRLYRLNGAQEITASQLYEYQYLARIYAAQERFGEAIGLAERIIEVADEADRFYISLELAVLKVLMLSGSGRTVEALSLLRKVLFISEARGYVRIYLDNGEPMAELLARLIESWDRFREENNPSLGYVRSLLTGFGRRSGKVELKTDLSLILTKKEQEIFGMLVRRKTNNEIAAELGIGFGTVRSHLNHIYSKLMVSSRSEAIRLGEQLGL